ncbi:hypothetical protein ACLMJK_004832 [Lecanora helva]
MYSKLLRVEIPSSSSVVPSPTTTNSSSASSSAQQLRSELRQAAGTEMVSTRARTRSHDSASASKPENETPIEERGNVKRRKIGHDEHTPTGDPPVATDPMVVIPVGNPVMHDEDQVSIREGSSEPDGGAIHSGNFEEKAAALDPPDATTLLASTSSIKPAGEDVPAVDPSSPIEILEGKDSNPETTQLSPSAPKPPKALREYKKPRDQTPQPAAPPQKEISALKDNTNTTPPPYTKATHKRFSSQEPETLRPPSEPQPQQPPDETLPDPASAPTDDAISSDNEAPETVTATTGQTQARAKTLNEAKAAAKLKEARKLRHKTRDARLKARAEKVKRSQIDESRRSEKKTRAKKGARVDDAATETPTGNDGSIPLHLPEHLLIDDPAPALSLSTHNPFPNPQKRKFHDLNPKPPKDITKHGVKIRVLEERNSVLPPKASVQGRAVREAWLMGRGAVERRRWDGGGGWVGSRVGGGFVRRK